MSEADFIEAAGRAELASVFMARLASIRELLAAGECMADALDVFARFDSTGNEPRVRLLQGRIFREAFGRWLPRAKAAAVDPRGCEVEAAEWLTVIERIFNRWTTWAVAECGRQLRDPTEEMVVWEAELEASRAVMAQARPGEAR